MRCVVFLELRGIDGVDQAQTIQGGGNMLSAISSQPSAQEIDASVADS